MKITNNPTLLTDEEKEKLKKTTSFLLKGRHKDIIITDSNCWWQCKDSIAAIQFLFDQGAQQFPYISYRHYL